jgi:hypothetical protein
VTKLSVSPLALAIESCQNVAGSEGNFRAVALQEANARKSLEGRAAHRESVGLLSSMHVYLTKHPATMEGVESRFMAHLAATSLMLPAKAKPSKALESFDKPTVALEGILDGVRTLVQEIEGSIAGAAEKMADYVQESGKCVEELEILLSEISSSLTTAPLAEPRLKCLKPEGWMSNLLYSGGFSNGLKKQLRDLKGLSGDYMELTQSSSDKLLKWFEENRSEGMSAFDSLVVSSDDFVIPGMSADPKVLNEINEASELELIPEDQIFSTQELPGGIRFLIKCSLGQFSSIDAIDEISKVTYWKATSSSEKLKFLGDQINREEQQVAIDWIRQNESRLGINAQLALSLHQKLHAEEDQEPKITSDIVTSPIEFKCLTPDEIANALSEVKNILDGIRYWTDNSLRDRWRAGGMNQIVSETLRKNLDSTASKHYMRAFCFAVTRMLLRQNFGVQPYVLNTLRSVLLYCKKSARLHYQ